MKHTTKIGGSVLLAVMVLAGAAPAHAYGPEGLFGGRPMPDNTLALSKPVELRNDRPERSESVLDRPRPDYDAAPIEIGSFELFPTLELGETYDDNIFAANTNERDDAVGTFRPIVTLFSNWGRHALSLTTFGDINYFSEHPDENYNNAVVDVNGRYDIANQIWLAGRAGYQHLSESRGSPNDVGGSEPTTFNVANGGATFYRGVGKLRLNADYDFRQFDYNDTPSTAGDIDNSGRNRDEHVMGAMLKYDAGGNVQPYLRGSYNIRDYDSNPTHDSDGWQSVLGVTIDFGGITSLDLFGGWMVQYYDDFGTKEVISSPKIGGRLDWNVTGKTTVVLEADRSIEETTVTGFNSYYSTGGSLTVTHELLRNVLLEANYGYSRYDFNGLDKRHDNDMTAGLGARYLINRSLYTDLLYSWSNSDSSVDDSDYTRNMVTLRLGVRL